MALQSCQNFIHQSRLLTDLDEILEAQQNILAAPHIPAVKLSLYAIGAEPSQPILGRQHVAHGLRQNGIQCRILGVGIGHAGAPHHLAPILAAPALVRVIHVGAKLLYE